MKNIPGYVTEEGFNAFNVLDMYRGSVEDTREIIIAVLLFFMIEVLIRYVVMTIVEARKLFMILRNETEGYMRWKRLNR